VPRKPVVEVNVNPQQASNAIADYFSNIGRSLSSLIQETEVEVDSYLTGNFKNSCFFNMKLDK